MKISRFISFSLHFLLQYTAKKSFTRAPASPVHKLRGNFSATLDFVSNFQLVEQFSVHGATFKFLCLDSHSHAPSTSETIVKCRI